MTSVYLFNKPSLHGFITNMHSTRVSIGSFGRYTGQYKRKSCPNRNRGRTLLSGQKIHSLAQKATCNVATTIEGAAIRSTLSFLASFARKNGVVVARDGFNASMNSQTRRGPFLRISHSSRMLMNETALTLCIVATCSAKVLEHR